MARGVRLGVLAACAFATSYLLFSYVPGLFKDAPAANPSPAHWQSQCGAAFPHAEKVDVGHG
jgi:hypothetical protein